MGGISRAGFRALVGAWLLSSVMELAVAFLSEDFLPAPLREFSAGLPDDLRDPRAIALLGHALAILLGSIIALIGLLRLWGPARAFFGVSLLGSIIFNALGGPNVATGPETALNELSAALGGALLVLAYFTPAARYFESDQEDPPPLA